MSVWHTGNTIKLSAIISSFSRIKTLVSNNHGHYYNLKSIREEHYSSHHTGSMRSFEVFLLRMTKKIYLVTKVD